MVHQFKFNEYNIVLDICSGSIHVVDDIAYDIIEIYENHTQGEVFSLIFEKHAEKNVSSE